MEKFVIKTKYFLTKTVHCDLDFSSPCDYIEVLLSPDEVELGREAGVRRKAENLKAKNDTSKTDVQQEIQSCMAEIAMGKLFKTPVGINDLVVPHNIFTKQKHHIHDSYLNGVPCEIKTTHAANPTNCNLIANKQGFTRLPLFFNRPVLLTELSRCETKVIFKGWVPAHVVRRSSVMKARSERDAFYLVSKDKLYKPRELVDYVSFLKNKGLAEVGQSKDYAVIESL